MFNEVSLCSLANISKNEVKKLVQVYFNQFLSNYCLSFWQIYIFFWKILIFQFSHIFQIDLPSETNVSLVVLEEGTDTTRVIPIEIHVASKQKETIHGSIPENKPPGSLVKLKSKLPNTDSGNLQHAHSLPFELTQNGQLVTRQALG